jgi:hypothetical protein
MIRCMRPLFACVGLVVAAVLAGPARAQPCNHLIRPVTQCPHVGPAADGTMFYDPITQTLTASSRPISLSLCIPGTTYPDAPISTCDAAGATMQIRISVDKFGNLVPGTGTAMDLVMNGSFPGSFGGTCTPAPYSGLLLTGKIFRFGWSSCNACGSLGCTDPLPGRCASNFDMVFQPTGGALLPLFGTNNIAVLIVSENSSFMGLDCNADGQPDLFNSAFNSKFGTKCDMWATPRPTACCNPTTGQCQVADAGVACPSGTQPAVPATATCDPTPCSMGVCCDASTGACTLFYSGGGQAVASCDPNYYPFASSNPLTNIAFNESDILRATSPANGTFISMTDGYLKLWYNDEHAMALGVRQVMVKTASGITTTDYPTSPMTTNPGSVHNPSVGSTATTGDQQGTDTSGRPLYPSLFVTDLTVNGPNSHAGDWQFGGAAIAPTDVFGAWKYFTRTIDRTHTPAVVSLTADADPASNGWNLGAGDPAPAGLGDEGYGAEVRWSLASLNLIPCHIYRF